MISGLFALLTTDTTLSQLIGTRAYPLVLPDKPVMPAATMQLVSSVNSPGFSNRGSMRTRLQIDIYGASYADASNTRDAVINVLHGFRGTLSDGTVLSGATLLNLLDFEYDDAALLYRVGAEFYLFSNL